MECYLYRMIQQQSFSEEVIRLQEGKQMVPSSKLAKFNPFLDKQGMLRIGGRLQNTVWSFDRQHIILGKHYLMEVLITHHLQRKHKGVEALLAFLCQNFG